MSKNNTKTRRAEGGIRYEENRKKWRTTYKGKFIGRYATKKEAEKALYEYLSQNVSTGEVKFKDVYEQWYNAHLEEQILNKKKSKEEILSSDAFRGYRSSFAAFSELSEKEFTKLKIKEIEAEIKKKRQPTQRKMKSLIKMMAKYARKEEIIDEYKRHDFDAIDIAPSVKSEKHYPFSQEQINLLWNNANDDIYIQLILMLIYSGCRTGEMLSLKKTDVQIEKNCFWIQEGKNQNARRAVPIHKKTKPFFKNWLCHSESEYFITRIGGTPFKTKSDYNNFLDSYWVPKLDSIGIYHYIRENGDEAVHHPHDVRCTFTTRWTDQLLSEPIRKKIQGHSSGEIGLDVYTKPFIETMVKEVNKLK